MRSCAENIATTGRSPLTDRPATPTRVQTGEAVICRH